MVVNLFIYLPVKYPVFWCGTLKAIVSGDNAANKKDEKIIRQCKKCKDFILTILGHGEVKSWLHNFCHSYSE